MKVAFLVIPNMLVTSFSNAYELMYAARAKAISERLPNAQNIQLITLAADKQVSSLHNTIQVSADMSLSDSLAHSTRFDMIFVPTMWRNPNRIVEKYQIVSSWLKRQWEMGAVISATGTGVCFIADTGLMNGHAATTHWYHFEDFQNKYPDVALKRHHFITSSGKLFCAASINAQTDLVLHHVHRFIGKTVSEHLSRHFSNEVRQPYDRLSFDQEKENAHPDEVVLQAQLWLQNNLDQSQVSLTKLANHLGMSVRTFNRRFAQATGTTPIKYLQNQRMLEAKDLLKQSDLTIGEIAYRVGYMDVSYFSKLFKKEIGTSPKLWRMAIRRKLFKDF